MPVRNVEAELEKLTALSGASLDDALPALRKALGDRINVVVAKAARIAAERKLHDLLPDLLRAFDRLFEKPVERDPQCWGKNAIAKALVELECRQSAPFLRGIRHIQMEPLWGGQSDTASTLRGACVLALVVCTDIDPGKIQRCLVDALADPAAPVRVEASRALSQMDSGLVLRLKAHLGDEEPNVMGQVFDSLLQIESAEGVTFVAGFLKSPNDAIREEAALALGASRSAAAVALLRQAWEKTKEEILLRAISASRQQEAIEFLLDLVRDGRRKDASDAVEALALHKDREPEVRRLFQQRFGTEPRP